MRAVAHELTRRSLLGAGAGLVLGSVAVAGPATATRYATSIGSASSLRLWGKTRTKRVYVPVPYVGRDGRTYTSLNGAANLGGLLVLPGSADWFTPGVTALFGHRTSAGGLMRYANRLQLGDVFTFTIGDVSGSYVLVERQIAPSTTDDQFGSSLTDLTNWDTGGRHGISIRTRTKPNGLPTSTKFLMVLHLLPT
jgi:hypothetical protein